MRISLSEAEQEMLRDSHLSHAARLAYLLGLRPYVDVATGIVGDKRRVSSQSIREAIEYLPEPGSHRPPYRPSRDQVKRLLQRLEQVGAIRPMDKTRRTSPIRVSLPLMEVRPQEERPRSAQGGAPYTNGAAAGAGVNGSAQGAPKEERPPSEGQCYGDSNESPAAARAEPAKALAERYHDSLRVLQPIAAGWLMDWIEEYGEPAVRQGLAEYQQRVTDGEKVSNPAAYAAACIRQVTKRKSGQRKQGKVTTARQADEHEYTDEQTPEGFE